MTHHPRTLLIRLGALGDTLHASSAAVLLRKHCPHMEVDFLAAAGTEDLFLMIPAVTRAYGLSFRRIPFRVHPGWTVLRRTLNRRNYGLAYLMETNPRFLPLLDGIVADRKISLTEKRNSEGTAPSLPNLVRYQCALWEAGLVPKEVCFPELVVKEENDAGALDLLVSLGLDPEAPVVGLHAGNSYQARRMWRKRLGRSDLRCWPEEHWVEWVSRMHDANPRVQFVLFGGREDLGANERIAAGLRRVLPAARVGDAAGKTDLPLAAALLKRFSLFVATDTGPLHMAAALRVPFVGLYGPTRFDETQPFPPEPVGAVLRRDLACQPCYGTPNQRRCRENLCMQQIEPKEVVQKAIEVSPALFST